ADDQAVFVDESVLGGLPVAGFHAGVVGDGVEPLFGQPARRLFRLAARKAVDDARMPGMPAPYERKQLLAGVAFESDRITDVGPVEAVDEHPRIRAQQTAEYLPAGALIGGRRQRDTGYLFEALGQNAQLEI